MYVIAIKNLLQAEFLQVSLLQPKDTICCRARDAVEYESQVRNKPPFGSTFQTPTVDTDSML